jgi:hypothetical protein
MDCRSIAGVHSDLQVGQDTSHVENRHRVVDIATVLSASKKTYNAIFVGNMPSRQVTTLDELFLVTNNRVGRRAIF